MHKKNWEYPKNAQPCKKKICYKLKAQANFNQRSEPHSQKPLGYNKESAPVYRYIYFSLFECISITVSSSCSSNNCVRGMTWPAQRDLFRVTPVLQLDPAVSKTKLTLRFLHLSHTYKLYTFTYINMWRKKNKQKHLIKLWYPAQTACWMQVLIQYTNIRCIRTTHVHTNDTHTQNNTFYTNSCGCFFFFLLRSWENTRAHSHARAHTHRWIGGTCGRQLTLQDWASESPHKLYTLSFLSHFF